MDLFDRPYTTLYLSAIFELFDVEWYHDLEIWVRGHSRSFKLVPFQSLSAVSYWPSIVTMALSCIICEIDRDIGQKSWFFIPPCIRHSRSGGSRRNIAIPWYRKTIMVGLPDGEKTLRICVIVQTQYRRVTDGRTSCHSIVCAMHTRRTVKTDISSADTIPIYQHLQYIDDMFDISTHH